MALVDRRDHAKKDVFSKIREQCCATVCADLRSSERSSGSDSRAD